MHTAPIIEHSVNHAHEMPCNAFIPNVTVKHIRKNQRKEIAIAVRPITVRGKSSLNEFQHLVFHAENHNIKKQLFSTDNFLQKKTGGS
jgi:hypothetical protein